MKIIGLTGGTGSGKSTLSKIFMEYGAYIIDADIIARKVVEKGTDCLKELTNNYGKEILLNDGSLNRKKLGSIVFSDEKKLKLLNNITHKYITKEINFIIESIKSKNKNELIVIDAAVLIEAGLNEMCDFVIVVYADENLRLERVKERDGLSHIEATGRMNSQMSFGDIKKYADFLIKNEGSISDMKKQMIKIIKEIESGFI
jgi:dephospho-CoA kinase